MTVITSLIGRVGTAILRSLGMFLFRVELEKYKAKERFYGNVANPLKGKRTT